MRFLKKIVSLGHEHKILIALIFIFLLLIPLGIIQVNNLKVSREKKLEAFYQQQKEKKATLEKTYDQILKEQVEELAKERAESQKIAEKFDEAFTPSLPNCSKLQNRESIVILDNSCSYKIQALGQTTMAVIFIADDPSNTSTNDKVNLLKNGSSGTNLNYLNTFLKKESGRYGISGASIKLSFFGPYKLTKQPSEGLGYETAGETAEAFKETSEKNSVPENNFDMVHYVYLPNMQGSFAFPGSHRAFTSGFGEIIGVFIHETLHLFGADDKYRDNDCNTIGKADPFDKTQEPQALSDIMCRVAPLSSVIINKITAREIGWPN